MQSKSQDQKMKKTMDQNLEIEVKFFLNDEQMVRNKIITQGGVSKGRNFETNVRYEDRMHSLWARRSLLRLRKDDRIRLTVKRNPAQQSSDFKVLQELEVTVDDFDTMDKILVALDFHKEQIYEKWRETIAFKSVILCLDTLPFGKFLEIEGQKNKIRAAACALGLDWNRRILSNYLEIFDFIKHKKGLKFNDITFKNFENNPIQFQPYIHIFEAHPQKKP
jgi:adenylate cyclase class 2